MGRWYVRWDTGEVFQVTGCEAGLSTLSRQTFGGDIEALDDEDWAALPLAAIEPPRDVLGEVQAEGPEIPRRLDRAAPFTEWIEPDIG